MNSKFLSFACLSLLAIFRSNPMAVAVEPEPAAPAAVVAADREFLTALESGAAVTPAPAQPAKAAPARPVGASVAAREGQTPKAVAGTKKSSNDVNREKAREKAPKKTVTANAAAPAPKTKRTPTVRKTEVVEVRRAIPVERTTVVTTVTRHNNDDDDDEDDDDKDEDRDESGGKDNGFLSRLFSR